jgi:hypothetical protein
MSKKAQLHQDYFWFYQSTENHYQMPDPCSDNLMRAMHLARYYPEQLTDTDRYKILAAAEAYVHLAAHPAPTYKIIKQLRDLRTAVRESCND